MKINEELHNNPSQERLQEIYQYNEGRLVLLLYCT